MDSAPGFERHPTIPFPYPLSPYVDVENHVAMHAALAAICPGTPLSHTPGVENHAAMHAALAANGSDAPTTPRPTPLR
jgi:hypothetical protein